MGTLVLFPDTNVFLECVQLQQWQWKELTAADEILILIPRTVTRQIDNLKSAPVGKKAKRARSANAFFGQIVDSVNEKVELSTKKPKITVSFAPRVLLRQEDFPTLDLNASDDRIMAEILAYKNQNPECDLAALTADIGVRLTAKELGIPILKIPDGDDWRLPPEQNEDQKEIQKLRKELEELKSNEPSIELNFD
jgi:predicted ribonuclease YlaK